MKYNPYEVPANASDAFLVHQLARLLKDYCDISAASDEIHRRYLSKDSLRSVNYRELARETNPIPWKHVAAWGLFAAWFALGGFIIVGAESHWAKTLKARRIVVISLIGIGICAPLSTLFFFFLRAEYMSYFHLKTLPSDMDLIIGIGIRWLANNLSIVIAVEALGGLALWTLIRRRFDRAELVRAIKPGSGQAMLDITHI